MIMLKNDEGKRTALKAFITANSDSLRCTLRLYVLRTGLAYGDSVEALVDDLLSDMVREALSHAQRYDPERSARAWLLGIGVNLVRRYQAQQIRQNQREPLIRDLYPDHYEVDDDDVWFNSVAEIVTAPADANLDVKDTIESLLAAVGSTDQEVIRLAILYELDGAALAQALGISPGAARVRLHRALNRLRRAHQGGEA